MIFACARGPLIEQSPQAAREAQLLLQQAIALDPGYAEAHRWLALNLWMGWAHWGEPMDPNRRHGHGNGAESRGARPERRRLPLGSRPCAGLRAALAGIGCGVCGRARAGSELRRCLGDLSDIADAERPSRPKAIEQIRKAFRLNPHPPSWYYWLLGQAQYAARQYEAAVETLRKEETYRTGSRRFLAASLAQLGRLDEARREAEMFLVSNPHFTISHWVIDAAFPRRGDA